YWAAKERLFAWPGLRAAVVNCDDPHGRGLFMRLRERGLDLWSFAIEREARLQAQSLALTPAGLSFELVERDGQGEVCGRQSLSLPLVGRYNVYNLLGVLASARALGVSLAEAVQACAALTPVPGRMQQAEPDAPD